jgi:hypothetical protein
MLVTGPGYLDVEELQATLGANSDVSYEDYALAIDAASRWIDDRCSDPQRNLIRHFWQDQAATSRLYRAETIHLVRVGDFDSVDGTTVEVDLIGNGTWTVLDPESWQAEPLVRINGFPYCMITISHYGAMFPLDLKPRVRVTALWGWAEVPPTVKKACQILAVAYMNGTEVISMHDGYDIDATGPTNPVAMAEHLLRRYLPDDVPDPALPANYSPLR